MMRSVFRRRAGKGARRSALAANDGGGLADQAIVVQRVHHEQREVGAPGQVAGKDRIADMDREILDVEGAATLLGVSKTTIYKLAQAGSLPLSDFDIPVENAVEGMWGNEFWSPGSTPSGMICR